MEIKKNEIDFADFGKLIESCVSSIIGSPARMPEETKTYLHIFGDKIRISTYENGVKKSDREIMAAIRDIQVLNNRVVMVTFADGTTEKAVLDDSDTFSVEQGISICMMKKILSYCTNGNGNSVYNKLVDYGLKTYERITDSKKKSAKEKDEKVAKAKRDAERVKRKKARRAAKQREYDIEIQKEAYLRAMREFNNTSDTVAGK